MGLLDHLKSLDNDKFARSLRRSPFAIAEGANTEDAGEAEGQPGDVDTGILRKSIFAPAEEEHELSADEIAHLAFAHRHGLNFHKEEVVSLMNDFEEDGDPELLRRAIAILKHQISLEA